MATKRYLANDPRKRGGMVKVVLSAESVKRLQAQGYVITERPVQFVRND